MAPETAKVAKERVDDEDEGFSLVEKKRFLATIVRMGADDLTPRSTVVAVDGTNIRHKDTFGWWEAPRLDGSVRCRARAIRTIGHLSKAPKLFSQTRPVV